MKLMADCLVMNAAGQMNLSCLLQEREIGCLKKVISCGWEKACVRNRTQVQKTRDFFVLARPTGGPCDQNIQSQEQTKGHDSHSWLLGPNQCYVCCRCCSIIFSSGSSIVNTDGMSFPIKCCKKKQMSFLWVDQRKCTLWSCCRYKDERLW